MKTTRGFSRVQKTWWNSEVHHAAFVDSCSKSTFSWSSTIGVSMSSSSPRCLSVTASHCSFNPHGQVVLSCSSSQYNLIWSHIYIIVIGTWDHEPHSPQVHYKPTEIMSDSLKQLTIQPAILPRSERGVLEIDGIVLRVVISTGVVREHVILQHFRRV